VDKWILDAKKALARAEAFAARHPRALTGSVLGALGLFAITAFGIAPLAPDARDLPRRVVTEVVEHDALGAQVDALADFHVGLIRNGQTRANDTADNLLRRLGAFDPLAAKFLRSDALGRTVLAGRGGKLVQLSADADGTVQSIVVRYPVDDAAQASRRFERLTIARGADGFTARLEQAALQTELRMGSGTIRSSLFAATDEARIPDAIASQLADIFSADIDFHHELRAGDRFSLVYQTLTADGEPVAWDGANGRIVAAEFVNKGRSHSAVWYQDAQSAKGDYFAFDGSSRHSAFLASPLPFSRITSNFSMRLHPILKQWKQHLGTDFGAPTGTPVRAVGDGVIEFAGQQNGYGNVIFVRHAGGRETVYAHLSRILVKKGDRVAQGDKIGAVGMTGWATGPHLHFEFRVGGVQEDPRTLARAAEVVKLPATARAQFEQTVAALRPELDQAGRLDGASSGAE